MRAKQEALKPPDVYLMGIVLTLVGVGVLLVFDASYARMADAKWANNDIWYMAKRQLVYAAIGLLVMFAASRTRLTTLLKATVPLLVLSFLLLVAVLLVGTEINGAKRWLKAGPVCFQPSELAKLALVLYLAGVLAQRKMRVRRMSMGWAAPLCVIATTLLLIFAEPDLGTTLALAGACFLMFYAAGAMKRHLFLAIGGVGGLCWLAVRMAPYRLERIRVWLDPWRDPYGEGYQIIHSLIALGTGGLRGVGLCEGREKLYIPAASTDFIFSTLGEEAGFVGGLLVLALFVLFVYRGLDIGRRCKSTYPNMVAVGVTSAVGLQALINIAVVSAAIPATGVPLPFVSYGGSSLVSMLAGVGILLAVSRQVNVTLDDREIYENSFDGWRDGRACLSGYKRSSSSARSRAGRGVAVRR